MSRDSSCYSDGLLAGRPGFYSQRPIQSVVAAVTVGVKRPGHVADHSPRSNDKLKNYENMSSFPQTSS
jgi:hypothetical protein